MFHTCLVCIVLLLPLWRSLGWIHTPSGRHVHMAASRDLVMSSNCVARYGELRTAVRASKAAIRVTTRLYAEVFQKGCPLKLVMICHDFMIIWPQISWIIQVIWVMWINFLTLKRLAFESGGRYLFCRITAHLRVRRYFLWRSPAGRIGAKNGHEVSATLWNFCGFSWQRPWFLEGGSCKAQSILLPFAARWARLL